MDELSVIIGAVMLIIISLGAVLLSIFRYQEKKRQKLLRIVDIDGMDGVVFEQYIEALLNHKAYTTKRTTKTNDYGVDIIAEKNGEKIAIQIKRYASPVGRAAISDAVAGMNYYQCTRAMVITNSTFTSNAKALATVNSCKLVDRKILTDWIVEYSK